ncbi:MAG: hypothetical protein WCP31_03805 [Chloroflexales bacterium]
MLPFAHSPTLPGMHRHTQVAALGGFRRLLDPLVYLSGAALAPIDRTPSDLTDTSAQLISGAS